MFDFSFNTDFPPTLNSYYVKTARGIYISKAGKLYRQHIAEVLIQQIGEPPMLSDRLLVEVVLFPPDKRKRDLDNYLKALLDALTHYGLWEDDSQIDQLMVYRGAQTIGNKKGVTMLHVTPAGPKIPLGHYP